MVFIFCYLKLVVACMVRSIVLCTAICVPYSEPGIFAYPAPCWVPPHTLDQSGSSRCSAASSTHANERFFVEIAQPRQRLSTHYLRQAGGVRAQALQSLNRTARVGPARSAWGAMIGGGGVTVTRPAPPDWVGCGPSYTQAVSLFHVSKRVAARVEGRDDKASMHRRASLLHRVSPSTGPEDRWPVGFVQPVVRQHRASNGKIVESPKGSAASHWYIFRETPSYMHNKLPHRGRAWRYTGGPCGLGPSTPPATSSTLNGRHYPSWRWLSEYVSTSQRVFLAPISGRHDWPALAATATPTLDI
ncbi:hypothetical protein QBC34DRAFT_104304 [Podospora aff. communis PSN243]|uniref:Secreted protein n=1 Tax=Podospora aff. communis PSN243 TaxID=3040156 RepID=A0AAV9H404_9PEZI|nr:hypothetical protein QBC34DRAFT_104304 [Podospora aff. communis PSN243]